MIKNLIIAGGIAAMALCATQAFAECTEDQESTAGMLAAGVGKTAVSKVIAVTGKQMVNIESCEMRAGGYAVDFKYNFLAADGLYWVTGTAKVSGKDVKDLSITRMSPNLAAASAAKGVKLAAS